MTPGETNSNRLTAKQRQAVRELLTTGDTNQVAGIVGVSRSTLWRWLQRPDFLQALASAETQVLSELARRFAGNSDKALKVLLDTMSDNKASVSERLRASVSYLQLLPSIRLLGSLEQRLMELEQNDNKDSSDPSEQN